MICPDCKQKMTAYTLENKKLYLCEEGCGSQFFTYKALQTLISLPVSDIQEIFDLEEKISPKIPVYRECPNCSGVVFFKRNYNGDDSIVFDECGMCGGAFLTNGQFQKIHEKEFALPEELKNKEEHHVSDVFFLLSPDSLYQQKQREKRALAV